VLRSARIVAVGLCSQDKQANNMSAGPDLPNKHLPVHDRMNGKKPTLSVEGIQK